MQLKLVEDGQFRQVEACVRKIEYKVMEPEAAADKYNLTKEEKDRRDKILETNREHMKKQMILLAELRGSLKSKYLCHDLIEIYKFCEGDLKK